MFLSSDEFIGNMPEQYKETISSINEFMKVCVDEYKAEAVSMLTHTKAAKKTVETFYDHSRKPSNRYSTSDIFPDRNKVRWDGYAEFFVDETIATKYQWSEQANEIWDEKSNHREMAEMVLELRKAMDKLTDRQRECIELYFYEEFTQEEIGQLLNISRQTVTQHIEEGKKNITKILHEKCDFIPAF